MGNDYLAHYGVKGQHWRQHTQGKWQNHAVYAIGDQRHTDGTPIESGTKYGGLSNKKNAKTPKQRIKEWDSHIDVGNYPAASVEHFAYQRALKNKRDTYAKEHGLPTKYEDEKKNDFGNVQLSRAAKNARSTGKPAIKQGKKDAKNDFQLQMIDRGSKADAFKFSAKNSTAANLLLNSFFGNALNLYSSGRKYSAYKSRHGKGDHSNVEEVLQLGNRRRRINSLNKSFDTKITKSAIKRQQLSKDYLDSYSKQMDKLLSDSKNVKKIEKLNKKNTKLSMSEKTFFNKITEKIGGPGVLTGMSLAYNNLALPAAAGAVTGLTLSAAMELVNADALVLGKATVVPNFFRLWR